MEGDTFSVTSVMMINQPSENVCLYHDEQNVCTTVEKTAGRLLIFHFLRVATKVRDFQAEIPVLY